MKGSPAGLANAATTAASYTRYLPELMLLAVAAVWGGSYAVAKQVTLQVTVLHYLVLRFSLTAIVLTPSLLSMLGRQNVRKSLTVGATLGLLLLCIFVCETVGVTLTSATNAAFLISLCVALTPLVEWALLGRPPSQVVLAAVAACLAGVLLLSPSALMEPLRSKGDWLMLAAALLRALMMTLTRKMTQWHPVSALQLTAMQAWIVFLGALFALLSTDGQGLADTIPGNLDFWFLMGFLVLFCTVFAFFAQNYAAARSSPTKVVFLMGSEPIFGALFAWIFFGEMLSGWAWIGCGLILAGTGAVLRAPRK
ncbi:DMT family transporter [Rhodoferax sp. GW822-FHT02A01]|uniref:DMT family transporter n=1 Tax=Rhodoferax sp. GW822-FHT02A01 TaxID=3141537 RepID=UPI00315C987E